MEHLAGVHHWNEVGVRRGGTSLSEEKPVPIDGVGAWLFNPAP